MPMPMLTTDARCFIILCVSANVRPRPVKLPVCVGAQSPALAAVSVPVFADHCLSQAGHTVSIPAVGLARGPAVE
eukprot:877582-Lingulodinium_polyedra.AAC.1